MLQHMDFVEVLERVTAAVKVTEAGATVPCAGLLLLTGIVTSANGWLVSPDGYWASSCST